MRNLIQQLREAKSRPLTKRQRRALRDAAKDQTSTVAVPRNIAQQLQKRGLVQLTHETWEPHSWGKKTKSWPVVMLTPEGEKAAATEIERVKGLKAED